MSLGCAALDEAGVEADFTDVLTTEDPAQETLQS